jgi:hypothetical protein
MWRLIGKVIGPPSLLHDTCSFADFILLTRIALSAKLEAAERRLRKKELLGKLPNRPFRLPRKHVLL